VLFCPEIKDIYPKGYSTYVNVEGLSEKLCGLSRPGHFRGVATVVLKLFNIVLPDIAYFGQKDALQAFLIKRMVRDLNLDVMIKVLPIIREADGLAMSSRNSYLGEKDRRNAGVLYRAIRRAEEMVGAGEKNSERVVKEMKDLIEAAPASRIDYISIVDTVSLADAARLKKDREYLIALAVFMGKTRLIDNTMVKVPDEANEKDRCKQERLSV